jgi:AraC-like DNA-binding protein/predicted transcriptional regulator YdeE
MNNFPRVKNALEYIDDHLADPVNFELVANQFHISPYYFHRIFTAIVGKTITAYVRDRRIQRACMQLSLTEKTVTEICFDCGFDSAQAFSRAFKNACGVSPSVYRKTGRNPVITTVDELIRKFTNRLQGGIIVNPNIIKKEKILIAGTSGDGNHTGEIWQDFIKLDAEKPLKNKISDNGYEIRLYKGDECTVHVGVEVTDDNVADGYSIFEIPDSTYASFDVYVARGYDSENKAMDEWLKNNDRGYKEKLMGDTQYVVEFYDERFHGNSEDSIVEIWVPVEK